VRCDVNASDFLLLFTAQVCENLKMNSALLSRFGKFFLDSNPVGAPIFSSSDFTATWRRTADLIFILLDRPDESHDRMISEHIMGARSDGARSSSDRGDSQKRARDWETPTPLPSSAHPTGDGRAELTLQQSLCRRIRDARRAAGDSGSGSSSELRGVLHSGGLMPIELMRRYIEYARQYVHPRLSTGAAKALQRLYLMMRSEASAGQSLPVTTRHLESLIRLSQARARMDLRDEVRVHVYEVLIARAARARACVALTILFL
jgi:DNA helicase MCM8